MMAIISDIHGNYSALRGVLDDIDRRGIERIVCLGDVVGYYTEINLCCDELRRRNVKCVMGNHDWYMISGTGCNRSKSVNDCLKYQKKIISKDNYEWISEFPVIMREDGILMMHGGFDNPIDEYLNPSKEYFMDKEDEFFVTGHTHRQCLEEYKNGKKYCNPGSVGQPRDGDNRAAYAVFDKGKFNLYRVSYDYDKVGKLMNDAGFSSYYYGCLRDGSRYLHD